jgi:hypothetical protein
VCINGYFAADSGKIKIFIFFIESIKTRGGYGSEVKRKGVGDF